MNHTKNDRILNRSPRPLVAASPKPQTEPQTEPQMEPQMEPQTEPQTKLQGHARRRGTCAWAVIVPLAVLALPFFASCAGLMPPFGTPYEEYRGFKARTFVGTAEEVRPMVVEALQELGYQVNTGGEDRAYITAMHGMGSQDPAVTGGRRTWVRVGVQVRQVDMHRRAPRTLVEVEAENVQGTSDGPIDASFGAVPSTFYQELFDIVQVRVNRARPHVVRGFLPPA